MVWWFIDKSDGVVLGVLFELDDDDDDDEEADEGAPVDADEQELDGTSEIKSK